MGSRQTATLATSLSDRDRKGGRQKIARAFLINAVFCVMMASYALWQAVATHQLDARGLSTWRAQRAHDKFFVVPVRPGQTVRVRLERGASQKEARAIVSDYLAAEQSDGSRWYLPAEISGVGEPPIIPDLDLTFALLWLIAGITAGAGALFVSAILP
ncbi:hypothetical protein [Sphingomonas montanisoli]|uniref:Uncharacterized protein n=1 Tax=Sphingomonas montanisoli TaxID=2606412 RepID=A0A5D9C9V9_9SPHN|nr:hypothetical protein [Sphingomonas montanisoli]TZG28067.1 hypothetical protein FYJ91_11120 [Sphingomonas montanisoli]